MNAAAYARCASLLGATALSLLLGGCGGYTSDYRPPQDGRARVLFRDDEAVASLPKVDGACLREIDDASEGPTYRVRRGGGGGYGGVRIVYWVPVHHVVHPLLPPPFPLGVGAGAGHVGAGHVGAASAPRVLATPTARGAGGGHSSGSSGSHSSGSSSSSGGSGGDLGKGAVVVAVIVILALPVVTFGLVLSSPESEPQVATAIDRVNLFNDVARAPDSPCAAPPEPDEPPAPPPPPAEGSPEEAR